MSSNYQRVELNGQLVSYLDVHDGAYYPLDYPVILEQIEDGTLPLPADEPPEPSEDPRTFWLDYLDMIDPDDPDVNIVALVVRGLFTA